MTGTIHLHDARRVVVGKAEWMRVKDVPGGGTWKMEIEVADADRRHSNIVIFFCDKNEGQEPEIEWPL